ncbi:MAG TPA: hypothetical protein DCS97_08700 [Planctomycetes bacterium]|nr:hypothetical protein [Planctomycetota bacterium]
MTYCADHEAAIAHLGVLAAPGDTVLVLGAGDVGRLAPRLLTHFTLAPARESPGLIPALRT